MDVGKDQAGVCSHPDSLPGNGQTGLGAAGSHLGLRGPQLHPDRKVVWGPGLQVWSRRRNRELCGGTLGLNISSAVSKLCGFRQAS